LRVGPLGLAGGYGAPSKALLRAFERGANYWYHGSRRPPGMTQAVREILAMGKREELVLVLQSYARFAWLLALTFTRGLRALGLDYADVLLLGWHNRLPGDAIMERALSLKKRGLCRHIAISSHHRPAFVGFARDERFDVLHVRYNAAHTGAEQEVFPHLSKRNVGVTTYTATRWAALLDPAFTPPGDRTPTAPDCYREGEAPLKARDCYRFVLSQPHFDVCLSGPSTVEHVDEALAALDAGPLGAEEEARARRIGAHVHRHVRSLLAG
ncbi:MAG: hypothetical protein HY744_13805, partial [Deltaproteobacteria bacterium]|nr:hypothetical protein [Deltaproteobacteria bacterium]